MITTKEITSVIILLIFGLFAGGCTNNHQNPKTYRNKLMKLVKNNEDMQAMNSAMTSGDYQKAEEVRKNWVNHLTGALKQAKEIGGYQGDYTLQNAILKGLKSYKKAVTHDYKQLIAIRSEGGPSQQAKENKLIKNINQAFSSAAKTIHQASSNFAAKYLNKEYLSTE